MRIYKWTLAVTDVQSVDVQEGAEILTVGEQNGMPQMWAMVDESKPKAPRRVITYGTGHPMPDSPGRYVGTYFLGGLVFHVFDADWSERNDR